jgi:hypothetical protein
MVQLLMYKPHPLLSDIFPISSSLINIDQLLTPYSANEYKEPLASASIPSKILVSSYSGTPL